MLVWIAAAVGAIGDETRDNQPLNLLRSLVNLKDLRVAHELFDGVFAVVAVPAKNLKII